MTADVVLLTGGTSGIGRAAATRLGAEGATVVLVGRDRTAGERVAAAIEEADPDVTGRFCRVDLADFDAVRALSADVRADYDRLDVLLNNAGLANGERRLTADGIEETFAVNHLAPFLLTNLLAPRLPESAPATVLTTTSALHRQGDLSALDDVIAGRDFDGWQAYADSKLANVSFTYELAERLDDGVAATCVHPGWVPATGLFRNAPISARLVTTLAGAVARVAPVGPLESAASAGAALADVATKADLPTETGTYFDRRERVEPAPRALDPDRRERLWERSAELVGLPPSVPAVDPLA